MRDEDKAHFSNASRIFKAWILVRKTNEASLKYIGKTGYTPKPIDCKAKTADTDSGGKKLAGLVVSAETWPDVFNGKKAQEAGDLWVKFAAENGIASPKASPAAGGKSPKTLPGAKPKAAPIKKSGYGVDEDPESPHFGCVTLNGDYICGDYDLYDIVLAGQERRNLGAVEQLNGQFHVRPARLIPLQKYLEAQLGFDAIKHGGAAQCGGGFEAVLAFGPNGEQHEWTPVELQNRYQEWNRSFLFARK